MPGTRQQWAAADKSPTAAAAGRRRQSEQNRGRRICTAGSRDTVGTWL